MTLTLKKPTAQKIVETVKDVCGYDINFIDTNGIIFASTDPVRIGEFHEIGKKVVETRQTIEVQTDNSFLGTHKGVNIPFLYNRELIAVIGISGDPSEVRRYAVLAQKITGMILREHELDTQNYGQKNQINLVLHALFENRAINYDFLKEFMNLRKLSTEDTFRAIVVKLDARYHPSNLSVLETALYQALDQFPKVLYTFNYPNEYWIMLTDTIYQSWYYKLQRLADTYTGILNVGIGNSAPLSRVYGSYQEALIAVGSRTSQKNLIKYEDLTLDILLGALPPHIRTRYLERTISKLTGNDIQLLHVYYSSNLSLQQTADHLFLHKNTVQYQLNRINKITGFNPRTFEDAVILYLALELRQEPDYQTALNYPPGL